MTCLAFCVSFLQKKSSLLIHESFLPQKLPTYYTLFLPKASRFGVHKPLLLHNYFPLPSTVWCLTRPPVPKPLACLRTKTPSCQCHRASISQQMTSLSCSRSSRKSAAAVAVKIVMRRKLVSDFSSLSLSLSLFLSLSLSLCLSLSLSLPLPPYFHPSYTFTVEQISEQLSVIHM